MARGIRSLKCVKEGREFEIAIQESRDCRVQSLQGSVLAEKTLGALLFDHLPSAFGLPQETYHVPHSTYEAEDRNMSGSELARTLDVQQTGAHWIEVHTVDESFQIAAAESVDELHSLRAATARASAKPVPKSPILKMPEY
jgi:hypothetical protein